MIYEHIDLYAHFGIKRKDGGGGYLTAYIPDKIVTMQNKLRPAIAIFPGGAYCHVSERESEPIAFSFVSKSYAAFVLSYSIETQYPTPLVEACMAIAFIRENAAKYGIDGGHIGVIGFSAGGHLAGLLATFDNDKAVANILKDEVLKLSKPDAAILAYPVVTMRADKTHEITCKTITGGKSDLVARLSVEKRVNTDSVPAFIWHTAEDGAVPVENSLMLAEAYLKAGVPFALHIFEKGWHGLSLVNEVTLDSTESMDEISQVGKWTDLAFDWLKSRGFAVTEQR